MYLYVCDNDGCCVDGMWTADAVLEVTNAVQLFRPLSNRRKSPIPSQLSDISRQRRPRCSVCTGHWTRPHAVHCLWRLQGHQPWPIDFWPRSGRRTNQRTTSHVNRSGPNAADRWLNWGRMRVNVFPPFFPRGTAFPRVWETWTGNSDVGLCVTVFLTLSNTVVWLFLSPFPVIIFVKKRCNQKPDFMAKIHRIQFWLCFHYRSCWGSLLLFIWSLSWGGNSLSKGAHPLSRLLSLSFFGILNLAFMASRWSSLLSQFKHCRRSQQVSNLWWWHTGQF